MGACRLYLWIWKLVGYICEYGSFVAFTLHLSLCSSHRKSEDYGSIPLRDLDVFLRRGLLWVIKIPLLFLCCQSRSSHILFFRALLLHLDVYWMHTAGIPCYHTFERTCKDSQQDNVPNNCSLLSQSCLQSWIHEVLCFHGSLAWTQWTKLTEVRESGAWGLVRGKLKR